MKKVFLTIALICFATVMLFSPAFGTTYVVTQDGAGSLDGSNLANAMSLAGHNAATFAAGDTVRIDGTIAGLVPPSSGSAIGGYITYESYDYSTLGNYAIISPTESGTDDIGILNIDVDYLIFQYLKVADAGYRAVATLAASKHLSNIKIMHCHIDHSGGTDTVGYSAITFNGAASFNVSNIEVAYNYIIGNDGAENIDLIVGFRVDTGAHIHHNFLIDAASAGIDFNAGGANMIFEYNMIVNPNSIGIKTGAVTYAAANPIIRYNTIYNPGEWCLSLNNSTNMTLTGNLLFTKAAAAYGAIYNLGGTGTARDNSIIGDYAAGLWREYTHTLAQLKAAWTFTKNQWMQTGASTPIIYLNNDTGNHVQIANFTSTWQNTFPTDTNPAAITNAVIYFPGWMQSTIDLSTVDGTAEIPLRLSNDWRRNTPITGDYYYFREVQFIPRIGPPFKTVDRFVNYTAPETAYALLLETGDTLLLESGDKLLLE